MRILPLLYIYVVLNSQGVSESNFWPTESVVLLPTPENITVESKNFNHILHWSPGNGTPLGTVYNVRIDETWQCNTSDTSINVSTYMDKIYQTYNLQLWASLANRSSSVINFNFSPYESTIIGPPSLTLSGCGNCLNISITLPKPVNIPDNQISSFYNNIRFDIHWRKARGTKFTCHEPLSNHQSITSVPSLYIIRYLEPGEQYCVKAQPNSNAITHSLTSCWTCAFTSKAEPRGVAQLAGYVMGFVLLGFCMMILAVILVYIGCMCKPKSKIPTALTTFVPGYFLYPEDIHLSAAHTDCGKKMNTLQDRHEKKEKECAHMNEDDIEEYEHEEQESHCGYMDQANYIRNLQADGGSSISLFSDTDNSGGCHLKDTSTEVEETVVISEVQHDGVSDQIQAPWPVSVREDLNPLKPEKMVKHFDQKTEQDECFRNVNLMSVKLKSMQPEEDKMDDKTETKRPLTTFLLMELQYDSISALEPQTRSPVFSVLHTTCEQGKLQTALQYRQDDQNEFADTLVWDPTFAGYRRKHMSNEDEETNLQQDSYSLDYMTR